MNKCSSLGLWLALALLWVFAPVAQADAPVVRAVLFYSPSCGHCHEVMTEHLPPLFDKYGNQLQIVMVNAADPNGSLLYQAAVERFGVPPENQGVPLLVVADVVLVGSLEIPGQLPGLIEQHLAEGGVSWPDIPGLAQALIAGPAAPAGATSASGDADSGSDPAAAPKEVSAAPAAPDPESLASAGASGDLRSRLMRDPAGNALALVMLAGMVVAASWTALTLRRSPAGVQPAWHDWAIPILALVGLGVATYLAFVETTQTRAICGPVGDCNTVQQSEYALLLGFLPVGVLGVAGYVAILAMWALARLSSGRIHQLATVALFGLIAFGVLFSIYLTFLEPFVIGATCAWCLTSAAIMTLLLLLAAERVRRLHYPVASRSPLTGDARSSQPPANA